MNIILLGFKGCGKTYFGKRLADKLNWPFLETDTILEELYAQEYKQNLNCREIYQVAGEVKFRSLEKEAVAQLVGVENTVISVGGGTVLDPKNVELLLKIGRLVYLEAAFAVIQKRLEKIPAYAKADSFHAIYEARKPIYESLSAHKIDTEFLDEVGILRELENQTYT